MDPHFKRDNTCGYKQLYSSVMPLEVMLDKFQFSENRGLSKQKLVELQYNTVHQRYYKPEMSTKTKIAQIFSKKIRDQVLVKKHLRVRKDPIEKGKLDMI